MHQECLVDQLRHLGGRLVGDADRKRAARAGIFEYEIDVLAFARL